VLPRPHVPGPHPLAHPDAELVTAERAGVAHDASVVYKPGVEGYYDGSIAELINERPTVGGKPGLMRNWGAQTMYASYVGWGAKKVSYAYLDVPTWDGADMTSDGTYNTHIMSEMKSIDKKHAFKTYWHYCS
jgi:hypothetical protein